MNLDCSLESQRHISNMAEALRYWSECRPDDAAVYFTDGEDEEIRWSFADLDRGARAVAARLQASDMRGQRAVLMFPPGLEFIKALFGCLYAGVVAVPAFPPRRKREIWVQI